MFVLMTACAALAQPPSAPAPFDPKAAENAAAAEAPFLADHVQLTFPDLYLKAGEAYFDHRTPPRWIAFQATRRPDEGEEASPHYAMFVAPLAYDQAGRLTGVGRAQRVSPPGSANTCAWFAPDQSGMLIFGSTLRPPASKEAPGYQRGTSRYRWDFPPEMMVVNVFPTKPASGGDDPAKWSYPSGSAKPLLYPPGQPSYTAECSLSPDGEHLLYTRVNPATNDPNIYVHHFATGKDTPLVTAKGYDGGPFFSPDGKWICYRSDRRGDNNLQLFVAELAFKGPEAPAKTEIGRSMQLAEAGRIVGVKREIQLTDDANVVNWCPYWHPSMKYLVYATSQVDHSNYEVFAIEFPFAPQAGVPEAPGRPAPRRVRVTRADGFDGLPAFSDDGRFMMWTSQRGGTFRGEARPTSQLWIAAVKGEPDWSKAEALPAQFVAPSAGGQAAP